MRGRRPLRIPCRRQFGDRGDENHEPVFPAANLLANDFDADTTLNGDRLTLVRVATTDPAAGAATLDADGNVHFVPVRDYNGPAGFTYTVADQAGVEATATVSLTLLAVNDAPVTTGESVNGNEDTILSFNPADLLANDSDVDNAHAELTVAGVANPSHGTAFDATKRRDFSVYYQWHIPNRAAKRYPRALHRGPVAMRASKQIPRTSVCRKSREEKGYASFVCQKLLWPR